ncbi:MAG: M20/M25/M40 family metallo-hydrolase, partial [Candidatus Gastranaerophilaceae bacterium]
MLNSVTAYKNVTPYRQIHFTGNKKASALSSEALKIADKVSISNLEQHLNALTDPKTEGRGVGQKGIEIAKNYIANKFKQYGLKPVEELGLNDYFQNFIMSQYSTRSIRYGNNINGSINILDSNVKAITSNVLGMIKGSEHPDEFVIIGAHYDHLGKDAKKNIFFPGADDDISGIAAMMEIANIMTKQLPPKKSIIFAALTGEEASFMGANKLSKELLSKGIAKKTEVLNLEMLGGAGGNKLDIWDQGNNAAKNLVDTLEEAGNFINTKTQIHHQIDPGSDAQKFNSNGIPAVCVAWDFYLNGNHPYYHTAQDTSEKINKNVFKEAVRILTAASYLLANKL